jgi:DNA-3-methyladenine glycosylase
MYHCLNVVTERKNFPAAVLIRGLAKVEESRALKGSRLLSGIKKSLALISGPGKLCKFLHIDRKLNKWDLTKGKRLWIEPRDPKIKLLKMKKSRRIGIDYAQHCREYLWRFHIDLKG